MSRLRRIAGAFDPAERRSLTGLTGAVAGNNPWNANTLEWQTTSPPPHGNFATVPVVYHGPYEYSRPDTAEDFLPQTVKARDELAPVH